MEPSGSVRIFYMKGTYTIQYKRPYVVKDYALSTREGEAHPETDHAAAELLRMTANDARFLSDTIEQWMTGDVEPRPEDYTALSSIVKGFGEVMDLAAHTINGGGEHWALYADTPRGRERLGGFATFDMANRFKADTESMGGGIYKSLEIVAVE